MSSSPVRWVVCPECHKVNISANRYCQNCFGAVINPDIEITEEEEKEVQRRRQLYLRRRKAIRFSTIGIGILAGLVAIYLGLFFLTDTVNRPDQNLNSSSAPGEWAMFGNNLGHTGSAGTGTSVPQGRLLWTFSTGATVHSSPAVVDGTVYIGSQDHNLYALDAASGTKKWAYQTGSWVGSSPAVVDGKVYFGSNDGRFYAVNTQTGAKIWDFETEFPVTSSPSVAGDMVYFGSDDYFIYALNKDTGVKKWAFDAHAPVKSSPIIVHGILFTGTGGSGYSYSLNADDGHRRLRFRSHYAVYTSPSAKDGIIYMVANNGVIYAIEDTARTWLREHEIRPLWTQMWVMGIPGIPEPSPQSGLVWSYPLQSPSNTAPVISGDRLYVSADEQMVAIDLNTREELWRFETGGTIRSTPAVVGNTLFFGSEDGKLYAVDANIGSKLWDFQTGDKITASPAVAGGIVFIASEDGKVYALE